MAKAKRLLLVPLPATSSTVQGMYEEGWHIFKGGNFTKVVPKGWEEFTKKTSYGGGAICEMDNWNGANHFTRPAWVLPRARLIAASPTLLRYTMALTEGVRKIEWSPVADELFDAEFAVRLAITGELAIRGTFCKDPILEGPEPVHIPTSARCQEASHLSRNSYVPCGNQATTMVYHSRDKRSYYMCKMCADHNVRNRGGLLVAGAL